MSELSAFPVRANDPHKAFETDARTDLVQLGRYCCTQRHVGRGPEEVTRRHVINFPRYGVYVKHDHGRDIVVDPSRVVFFNQCMEFCTSHPHGCGDGGYFLALRKDLAVEIALAVDPQVEQDVGRPFRWTDTDVDPSIELAAVALFARGHDRTALEIDELGSTVAHAALRRAAGVVEVGADERPEHRELADAARWLIARRFREPLSLARIAGALGVSVFHLCRVFKRSTGTTMHAFQRRMRLAASLEPLAEGADDLTTLAIELGFASHSHFTREFRARFAIAPSEFRANARRGQVAGLIARLRIESDPRVG